MIIKTQFGEDKLKFTVTYLDGKKLPKELAGRVQYALNNLSQLETLQERVASYFSQKQSLEANILTLQEVLRKSEDSHNLEKQQWHEREMLNTEKVVVLENIVREITQQKKSLENELEQTRLDSSSTEKRFQEHVAGLNLEIAKVEAKYRDVLELSNRQTWGVVVSATVGLVSLILYCSTL
jgi:chromosome segregation ATPase